MKADIDPMMRRGAIAEHLAIEHVRQPGQRMPVTRVKSGESPLEADWAEAQENSRIICDVLVVIEVKKPGVVYRPVSRDNGQDQKQANQDSAAHF